METTTTGGGLGLIFGLGLASGSKESKGSCFITHFLFEVWSKRPLSFLMEFELKLSCVGQNKKYIIYLVAQ